MGLSLIWRLYNLLLSFHCSIYIHSFDNWSPSRNSIMSLELDTIENNVTTQAQERGGK